MTINSDTPYILRLPRDVNKLIFGLLDPASLARISRSCDSLRTIAHEVAMEQFGKKNKLEDFRTYSAEDRRLAQLVSLNRKKKQHSEELERNRIPEDLLPTFLTPTFKAAARSQAVFKEGQGNLDQIDIKQQKYSNEIVMRCVVETLKSPCYISYQTKIYNVFTIHHPNGKIESIKVWTNGLISEGKTMPCLKGYRKISVNPV